MSKHSVVLIDDNPIFRMIFGNIIKNIEDIDVDFTSYENALEALDALTDAQTVRSQSPDYIFVDINMPYMTGWEMMDKVQEENYPFIQKSKVFIISSSHLESDKEKINQYPFISAYVQKPVNMDTLKDLLAKS